MSEASDGSRNEDRCEQTPGQTGFDVAAAASPETVKGRDHS